MLTYGIVSGAVPVQHHEATITVTPKGDGSHVTYDVDTDDAMVDMMSGMYASSLKALKRRSSAPAGSSPPSATTATPSSTTSSPTTAS